MNKQESDILNALLLEPFINQRILAEVSGHSLGVVNRSLKELIKAGYLNEAICPTANVPILIIHGDKDNRAPLSMAYKIYDSCQGEKDLYIVSGATHKECYRTNPEKYEKIVSEFIEKNLP